MYWSKRWYGEWKITARRHLLIEQLSDALGSAVTLRVWGDGGNDSIYLVFDGQTPIAVARLFNPYKVGFHRIKRRRSARPNAGDNLARMDREWQLCLHLGEQNLTPPALWRAEDVTVVGYLPGDRLPAVLRREPERWWHWMERSVEALSRLHQEGVAHLDAKATNTIVDPSDATVRFIDLDCMPKPGHTLAQQQAFDYLKFVGSGLLLGRRAVREDAGRWASLLDTYVPHEVRGVDVTPYLGKRALRHVVRNRPLCQALEPWFPALVRARSDSPQVVVSTRG